MKYFTLFVLLAVSVTSCKKDEVAVQQTAATKNVLQSVVAGVNGPTSGAVNQDLLFTLVWPNTNNQHNFDSLAITPVQANVQHIKLYVTKDTTIRTKRQLSATFKFKAAQPGTYYLKFAKPSNDSSYSIVDTVTIR
ncbi:hypothetical protein [Mucilaginibacter sp.]